jgi:hypothetical protein
MITINKEGLEIELNDDLINSLKLRLKGPVLLSGDTGFEDSRTVWNSMINKNPSLVVKCLNTTDVIECVKFANKNNLLLCIKGGGYNIAGLATADGAMMLDMSLMHGVWVNKDSKIAHAQAGCLIGDVDRETQIHGLAAVLGSVSQTGITGLTLGGGYGYLTRRWGWTADNIAGIDVVTAMGCLVHASYKENADLFWGMRGGGGNFGVVTAIDYNLHPVGPEIVGGFVAWPGGEISKVLDFFRAFAENAPQELTVAAVLRSAPPEPWLPNKWHGKLIISLLACYSGDPAEGEKVVAPIKKFGKPIGDVLIRRPYTQMQSMLDATAPKGRRYYWKSEYLSFIEPKLCEKIIPYANSIPSPHSSIILFQLAGTINIFDDEYSPVGNREARYVLTIPGSWENSNDDNKNIAWVRSVWNDLKEFSTGGTYINYLTEDEGQERIEAALGGAIKRLSKIKRKWDPENMFRTNHNIKPA